MDDQERLLTEIRDILREQLQEYKRVTSRSLEIQQRSVQKQEQFWWLYRLVIAGGVLVLIGLGWFLFRLVNP
jgi:hypothetical protein